MQGTTFFLSLGINLIIVALVYIKLARDLRQRRASASVIAEIREEAEELVKEINQVTDRNIVLIENSVTRLNNAIEEADKRIRVLGKHTENLKQEQVTYNHLKTSLLQPKADVEHFDQLLDRRKSQDPGHLSPQREEGGQGAQEKPIRAQVLELSRKGFSSQVIAQKTGRTIGEVELMINLANGDSEEVDYDNRY